MSQLFLQHHPYFVPDYAGYFVQRSLYWDHWKNKIKTNHVHLNVSLQNPELHSFLWTPMWTTPSLLWLKTTASPRAIPGKPLHLNLQNLTPGILLDKEFTPSLVSISSVGLSTPDTCWDSFLEGPSLPWLKIKLNFVFTTLFYSLTGETVKMNAASLHPHPQPSGTIFILENIKAQKNWNN